jgi:hypothetical protein
MFKSINCGSEFAPIIIKNLIFIFTTHFSSGYDPGEFEDIASD